MAITYFGSASNPSDNGSLATTSPVEITPPADMQEGDLVLLVVGIRDSATPTISVVEDGGQSWTTAKTQTYSSTATAAVFWCRFGGTWDANPTVQMSGATAYNITAVMHVFRTTGDGTWAENVAAYSTSSAAPASPYDITITSGVTVTAPSVLAVAVWFSTDDNTYSLQTSGWSVLGEAQYRNTYGNDSSITAAWKTVSVDAVGSVVARQETLGGDAYITFLVTLADTSIVYVDAEPLESTGSMRLVEWIHSEAFEAESEIIPPSVSGTLVAVLSPAEVSIEGDFTAGIVSQANIVVGFPSFICEAATGSSIECVFPELSCESFAYNNIEAEVECDFPDWQVEAATGSLVEAEFPEWTCESSATVNYHAEIVCDLPEWQCEATALTGATVSVEATFPYWQVESYVNTNTYASAVCELPEWQIESIVTSGAAAWVSAEFPEFSVEASAFSDIDVQAECIVPAFICEAETTSPSRFHSDTLSFSRW